MLKSIACLLLICAPALMASGCKTTANEGAGFSVMHPSPATRQFIIANDVPFAREVVAHNKTCASMPACAQ